MVFHTAKWNWKWKLNWLQCMKLVHTIFHPFLFTNNLSMLTPIEQGIFQVFMLVNDMVQKHFKLCQYHIIILIQSSCCTPVQVSLAGFDPIIDDFKPFLLAKLCQHFSYFWNIWTVVVNNAYSNSLKASFCMNI